MPKRKPTKKELETMLEQIEKGDPISVFNAKKALYIQVEGTIVDMIKAQLEGMLFLMGGEE